MMVNIGKNNTHCASFINDVMKAEAILHSTTRENLSLKEHFGTELWKCLAWHAYHDADKPTDQKRDYTNISNVPVSPYNSTFYDTSVLFHMFDCEIECTPADVTYKLSACEALAPRKAPHEAHNLEPNSASHTLNHTLCLQLFNLVVDKAPTQASRKTITSLACIGARDVMGLPATYGNVVPPEVFTHFFRLKFDLTVTQAVDNRCKRCGVVMGGADNQPDDIQVLSHSVACNKNQYYIKNRHDRVRNVCVHWLNKETHQGDAMTAYPELLVGERETRGEDGAVVIEREYSDVTTVSYSNNSSSRSDIDILVMSSLSQSERHKLTTQQLNEGYRRKERHYNNRGFQFIPGVEGVIPFVMLDNGAIHPRANSWLYDMVNTKYNKWREGHILNSLQVQYIRAKLALTVMSWAYYCFEATQYHGLVEVPQGRLEVTVEGLMGRNQ